MEGIKNFFRGLSRSTKITLISCGSFLLLTIIILLFFVLFPITPSERIITGLGRSGIISTENGDNGGEGDDIVPAVTTTGVERPEADMIGTAAIGLDDYSQYNQMATYTNQQAGTYLSYIYSGQGGIRVGTPGEYTTVSTINPEPTEPPYAPQTSEPNDTPQQTTAVGGSQTPQTTTVAVDEPQSTEVPVEKPTEAPKTEAPETPTAAPPKEQEAAE